MNASPFRIRTRAFSGRLRITPSGERAAGAQARIRAEAATGSTCDGSEVAQDGAVFVPVPTPFEILRAVPDREDAVRVDDARIDHPSSVQSVSYDPEQIPSVTTDGALKGSGGEGGGPVVEVSSEIELDDSSDICRAGAGLRFRARTLDQGGTVPFVGVGRRVMPRNEQPGRSCLRLTRGMGWV